MKKRITGEQAKTNFDAADKLVRAGLFQEAESLYDRMLPSDVGIIARRIMKAKEAIAQTAESGNKVGGDRKPGDAGSSPAGSA